MREGERGEINIRFACSGICPFGFVKQGDCITFCRLLRDRSIRLINLLNLSSS